MYRCKIVEVASGVYIVLVSVAEKLKLRITERVGVDFLTREKDKIIDVYEVDICGILRTKTCN